MKETDINEYEIGEHCFGPILRVNGNDYEDLSKEDIVEFINDMFTNNLNSNHLIMETLKLTLQYLEFDCTESDSDSCEQCGNYNNYSKFVRDEK